MAAKQAAEKLISEHLVAIFSKSYCPYCSQAKSVIAKLGLDPAKVGILELDNMGSEGSDIQAYLAEKTSQRTVPNIFINQKHLGGCSDLLNAQSQGKLDQLLKA
ncbi:glutaredoxin [Testicularia cyperi]|uniref:glutathione peroxidase n=1 Tax=Testicularia cyperi TaxID=1882483 RepID=A0A317XN36_9BASI|nr:glutaredoxin [Testicularia cyperi]